jgi:hypothetical protein
MFEFCWDFSESPKPLVGHVNVITQRLQGAYIDCLYFCIYSVCGHAFKLVDFAISATTVTDSFVQLITQPCNLHRQMLAVEWP